LIDWGDVPPRRAAFGKEGGGIQQGSHPEPGVPNGPAAEDLNLIPESHKASREGRTLPPPNKREICTAYAQNLKPSIATGRPSLSSLCCRTRKGVLRRTARPHSTLVANLRETIHAMLPNVEGSVKADSSSLFLPYRNPDERDPSSVGQPPTRMIVW